MTHRILRLAAAACLAVATLGAGTAAAAASPEAQGVALYKTILASPNPLAAYNQLGSAQQGLVRLVLTFDHADVVTPAAEPATGLVVAASGCWGATKSIQGKSAAGIVVWQWNVHISWCASGTRITSKSHSEYPTSVALTWAYNDDGDWPHLNPSGGVGAGSYTMWAQAHFQWCPLPLVGCVQHQYPWASVTGRANGTFTGSAGV
jgi:hypothetical protein